MTKPKPIRDRGLFTPTPTSEPATDGLFTNTPNPHTKQKTPKPRPARWRDEDMPLRPGDIITVGLTNGRAPIGQVTAVNDHCFRLNDRFTSSVIVVAWWQVSEFGPVARKRGDHGYDMEPLLTFHGDWQNTHRW